MRVLRDAEQPPPWSLRLLERLADYVFISGSPFAEGHRMNPGGPITGQPDTRLQAVALAADPQLPSISSAFGAARFLTVVGITADELERMKATTTATVLHELAARITDAGNRFDALDQDLGKCARGRGVFLALG